MNDLLEKFDSIEIKNTVRLSEEDFMFCVEQHELYFVVLDHYRGIFERLMMLKDETTAFYDSVSSLNTYEKRCVKYKRYKEEFIEMDKGIFLEMIISVHDKFIKTINDYFRDKYNISIEDGEFEEYSNLKEPQEPAYHTSHQLFCEVDKQELKSCRIQHAKDYENYLDSVIGYTLHYDVIVDDIFSALGSLSFGEKTEQDIKEALISSSGDMVKYEIKNSKISFNILNPVKSYYNEYEVRLNDDSYKAVLRALTYFDSSRKSTTMYDGWQSRFVDYKKSEKDGIFDVHDTSCDVVQTFRYYKNGKFEVGFGTHANALRFAREYLGYSEIEL